MSEVYFDDFKVEHVKSPVVQSQEYYPFGLTYNSYSKENSSPNQWKFQGQENQDELGLGWDSFKWRNHMPELGKFFNVDPLSSDYVYNSPYAFSENHVVAHVELEGLEKVHFTIEPVYPEVVFQPNRFGVRYTKSLSAFTFVIDLQKRTIINSNCVGADCDKGLQLTTSKDGSMSISGIADFKDDGMAGFKLNISSSYEKDQRINVESTLVTENKSAFQMFIGATTEGQPDKSYGAVLLNVVPKITKGGFFSVPPKTTGSKSNTDLELYNYAETDRTSFFGVKDSEDSKFKNYIEFNKDKERTNTIRKEK